MNPEISVVIPVYDEEASLEELVKRLNPVLMETAGGSYEILFVDDGSRDGSWERIRELHAAHPGQVRGIRHRRNFGKAAALANGFAAARGDIILTMDADLQDQPEEIPKFLAALEAGADMVSGWKKIRRDPLDKTLPSRVFNFLVRASSGLKLHDINCGFKAYRADVAKSIRLYGEMHRFIPILAAAEGYSVAEVPIEHRPRTTGHSKYGATRFVKGALDLMTVVLLARYLRRPGHVFGGFGLLSTLSGFLVLAALSFNKVFLGASIGNRPLFFLGILLLLLGVQLFCFGFLGEFLLRYMGFSRPANTSAVVQVEGFDNRQDTRVGL